MSNRRRHHVLTALTGRLILSAPKVQFFGGTRQWKSSARRRASWQRYNLKIPERSIHVVIAFADIEAMIDQKLLDPDHAENWDRVGEAALRLMHRALYLK